MKYHLTLKVSAADVGRVIAAVGNLAEIANCVPAPAEPSKTQPAHRALPRDPAGNRITVLDIILRHLASKEPCTQIELGSAVKRESGGRLAENSASPRLSNMMRDGLVALDDFGRFSLTEAGRKLAKERA